MHVRYLRSKTDILISHRFLESSGQNVAKGWFVNFVVLST